MQFASIWACFDVGGQACTTFCMHNAVQGAFKRRNISNDGEKYRLISYKIDELLQFACIWACFDDGKRVHYFLQV